jgi:pimeloyl-ACP methyl ester carboxylesterase
VGTTAAASDPAPGLRRRHLEANGVDFALLETGPDDGPLALCLHGFPDTAWTWRHLAPALAATGRHVVAPFMRGYAPTAVPADGRYQTGVLAADANALHEALGGGPDAVLVGHDWGAATAYGAAAFAPERWARVVALAVPPPALIAAAFTTYAQLKRSWYMWFGLTPLADLLVPVDGFAFLAGLWADWSPGYDAAWDLARVVDSLAPDGHLTAALGYYRAQFGVLAADATLAAEQAATTAPVPQPTLYLHGRDDGCIGAEVAAGVLDHLGPGSQTAIVDSTGHFLHLEDPDGVGGRILDFLGRS